MATQKVARGAMLSREKIAKIRLEIEKLRESLDGCVDTGLRQLIEALIEQQEPTLESERDSKSQPTDRSKGQ
jgi:hypothetical protein